MTEYKPVIELEGYRLTDVNFKTYEDLEIIKELEVENGRLEASATFNESYTKAFLQLKSTIVDEINFRVISVEITGQFTINEENEDKAEEYLRLNGTAILMPYLRAFVSVLTSLDNNDAIVLPTINTHNFKDKDTE